MVGQVSALDSQPSDPDFGEVACEHQQSPCRLSEQRRRLALRDK